MSKNIENMVEFLRDSTHNDQARRLLLDAATKFYNAIGELGRSDTDSLNLPTIDQIYDELTRWLEGAGEIT